MLRMCTCFMHSVSRMSSLSASALSFPPHSPTSAEHSHAYNMSPACQFIPSKGPGDHGSLWIEEREGRIKVLDIKGICDDGIDTLESQSEPICDWIDRARSEGGKVPVHCRVGVLRSATVTMSSFYSSLCWTCFLLMGWLDCLHYETPQPPSRRCVPH